MLAKIKEHKKAILLVVTFTLGGLAAIGYGIPPELSSILTGWIGGL